jgi:hypothetical protein
LPHLYGDIHLGLIRDASRWRACVDRRVSPWCELAWRLWRRGASRQLQVTSNSPQRRFRSEAIPVVIFTAVLLYSIVTLQQRYFTALPFLISLLLGIATSRLRYFLTLLLLNIRPDRL